ncbi:ATP-binding cassette domain-containing protein [Candidatus Fermentibacterales bacterium]|nr:ATP-binding cassette domain-containing protein [Candidatus Fermentibacterales bacterium]
MSVLEISGYSDPPRIRNLSLTVDCGELVLVQGNAGSGKSALFEAIAGLRRSPRGRIRIGGAPACDQESRLRSAFVFQYPAYDPGRSSFNQLVRRLCLYLRSSRDAHGMAVAWSRAWGVPILARQSPDSLTTSQSRLLELALVQILSWDLIVMDEPLQGLDPEVVERFLALLVLKKESSAMLCFAQRGGQLSRLADRTIELPQGATAEQRPEQ